MKDIDLDLLKNLPLVTLTDAVLMPKLRIPIILTRSEYSALRHSHKGYIGVVQLDGPHTGTKSPLFQTGCLGQIIDIEMIENRLIIEVEGICRFNIKEIKAVPFEENPILCVDYNRYLHDLDDTNDIQDDVWLSKNENLDKIQQRVFIDIAEKQDININILKKISNQKIIAALSAISPLQPIEKQAILERETVNEQSQLMIEFMFDHSIVNRFYSGNNSTTYH